MAEEQVRITSDNGFQILGQSSIAVRHGAYILLEKLGVRWYMKHPAWEVVPTELADLGVFDEIHEPAYHSRILESSSIINMSLLKDWNRRNRLFGTRLYIDGQNYQFIIPHAEITTHPEYFLPVGGDINTWPWQLDGSHPDVIARAIQFVRNQLALPPITYGNFPDVLPYGSYPVVPNDGAGWSPYTGTQAITDLAWGLANEVAKDIQADFPGMLICMLTYAEYAGIPSIDIEPNLLTYITTEFNLSGLSIEQQIDGMVAKGIQVGIYEYLDIWTWWHDQPPNVAYQAKIRALSYWFNRGVRYFMSEGADAWGSKGLEYWLTSKLLWNPSLDIDILRDDFYSRAFGPVKTIMQHYYETRGSTLAEVGSSFRDLAEAEALVGGPADAEYLERIRHLEYYTRFLWLFHAIGVTNLTLPELQGFYTFITKMRDLYILSYPLIEQELRAELIARGLTTANIDVLRDFTPPIAVEAAAWMLEAMVAFGQPSPDPPWIDPRYLELISLGDTTNPRVEPSHGMFRKFYVPSAGDEDITVLVKEGVGGSPPRLGSGIFNWYNPFGVLVESQVLQDAADWTALIFHADTPGNYVLESPKFPAWSYQIDIPDHAASWLTERIADLPESYYQLWLYGGPNEVYFYVPANTGFFSFGIGRPPPQPTSWFISGRVIDPAGDVQIEFNVNEATVWQINNPVSGVWKLITDQSALVPSTPVWLLGIPPLVWHDPQYLLAEEVSVLPPIPEPTPGIVPDTIALLSPSDEALNSAATELKTYLEHMGQPMTIVQGDVAGPAIRLEVAVEPELQYSLTLSVSGQGETIPATGTHSLPAGIVDLSAIPVAGWLFERWMGDIDSTVNPISVDLQSDMAITAVFQEMIIPPTEYAVTISVIGQGTTEPVPGAYTVPENSDFVITATPATGWRFDHWEGDISGNTNPVTFTVDENLTVLAVFTEKPVLPPTNLLVGAIAITGIIALALKRRR